MKKICLTMGLALLSLSSFAGTRVLYSQNFENVASPEDAGWTYGGESISIASDDFGKFLELALGQNNGRSGICTWGEEIYTNADGESYLEFGTYTMQFDFSIKTNSNNQYNTDITVFTNHTPIDNQPFRAPWSGTQPYAWNNFIFDIYQTNTAADADMTGVINEPYTITTTANDDGTETTEYKISADNSKTFATGTWYSVTVDVDVESRTAEYNIVDAAGAYFDSGVWEVPETQYQEGADPISMYAQGLFVMTARYQTTIDIDNIKITCEIDGDFAGEPTIALTTVGQDADEVLDLNMRGYSITFAETETLHLIGTDGVEEEIEWGDCDGTYKYYTATSGTLTAWTVSGDATSEKVEVAVDCTPCVLPEAVATISSVSAGFGKTYTLTVSNADVPTRPTIFIDYEYTCEDGTVISESGAASGVAVAVPDKGVLKVTTKAYGFQASELSVNNDLEFEVKTDYDFARMTKDDFAAAGFSTWNVLNSSSTSGFNNWTARKRLFYYDAASATKDEESGETVYTTVYPFGFISEDDTVNVIEYSEMSADTNVAGYELFKGIVVYAGHNVSAMLHVGVYNNETSGGNNKNIDVLNLDPTDFVLINRINNYGGNSCHPTVETVEEYYAQLAGDNEVYSVASSGVEAENGLYTVSMPVYRIDTAATRVTVFAQKGAPSAVEGIEAAPVENGDGKWYNLQGIQVAEPNASGIYIHNGKKVLIRK